MPAEHSSFARGRNGLLPHPVDQIAAERPHDTYALWPVAPFSYEAGFRTLTWSDLANVVNGLAWLLDQKLGRSKDQEVLSYVGPNDVRYAALILAAVKTGYVMFMTSPRNSAAAHQSLFEAVQCRILLTSDPTPPAASPIIDAVKPLKVVTLPSVDELLGETHPVYEYRKTFAETRLESMLIIHTSGSTGIPKPLVWTHESGARALNVVSSAPPEGVRSVENLYRGKRVLVTLPPFHGAAITLFTFDAIVLDITLVAPASKGIVTGQGLVEALQQTPAQVALLVPSVVAEIGQDAALLEYCAQHLELILYIGGDLPQEIGDRVASRIPLRCQWGASEVGIPPQLLPPELGPMDWRYIRFHPSVGAEFDQVTDDRYELVIRRREELSNTQLAFSVRGQEHLTEYRTRDFFAKHPTVPDAWCWQARADDIIVFLNGEKTNPISMEQHVVTSNPDLSGALVVGSQRLQAALLVEPARPAEFEMTAAQAALIERVWSSVVEANQVAPAHARVEKALILVTKADKPLVRSGKGTVQRQASIKQYASEIDKLYADAEMAEDEDHDQAQRTLSSTDLITIASLVRDSVLSVTGWPTIGDSDGFFDRGLDSLQGLQITRALRRALHIPHLALSTIYQNPTIEQLTAKIINVNDGADDGDRDLMEPLLSTYTELIKQIPTSVSSSFSLDGPIPRPLEVILTGSTGNIGTYLLHTLLRHPDIGHVYCLNRAADGGHEAQRNRFKVAHLTTDNLENNHVTFLHADLAHPTLGLSTQVYTMLRSRICLIIHNAWPVNFNLNLSSFRPQLASIVQLCALANSAAPRPARLVFISSVSAVATANVSAAPAPDAILRSPDAPFAGGYGRSKALAERLCDFASAHLGIHVAIARVGQVAGAARRPGVWNPAEWLPSLVISSLYLGCVPDSLGPHFSKVDWLPADLLADVVVDLAVAACGREGNGRGGGGAEVFNLRNPHIVSWSELLPAILETAQARRGRALEIVSPAVWLERLMESMAASEDLAAAAVQNPAIKLLGFYRHALWAEGSLTSFSMSVGRASVASASLREVQPVGRDWIRKWVGEWMEL